MEVATRNAHAQTVALEIDTGIPQLDAEIPEKSSITNNTNSSVVRSTRRRSDPFVVQATALAEAAMANNLMTEESSHGFITPSLVLTTSL